MVLYTSFTGRRIIDKQKTMKQMQLMKQIVKARPTECSKVPYIPVANATTMASIA